VDFRNAVLVMTSNVGSTALSSWPGAIRSALARKPSKRCGSVQPEFINRIDEMCCSTPGHDQLDKIVDLELAK